jgi:hypothetical protein
MKIAVFNVAAVAMLISGHSAESQTSARNPQLPSCAEDLSALASKLYDDYAGFRLEVKGERRTSYEAMFNAARARAEKTTAADCYPVLDHYIAWFDDPHLFIYQNDAIDSANARRLARDVRRIDMTEDKARALFASRGRQGDPIEGIWYDRKLRVAIIPQSRRKRGKLRRHHSSAGHRELAGRRRARNVQTPPRRLLRGLGGEPRLFSRPPRWADLQAPASQACPNAMGQSLPGC